MSNHLYRMARRRDDTGGIMLHADQGNESAKQAYKLLGMNGSHYYLFKVDFVP